MKLSIIIVNFNVEYFLEQCLHSVRKALTGVDAEVFVVDNNSVDASVSMVREKFPEVKLIENKKNTGFSFANNQAIRISTGEYILLLNPDTVVEEDTFVKTIAFMDSHSDAGALGVMMLDGKGNFLPESKRGLPTPNVAFYKISGLSRLFPRSKTFGKYHLGYLDKNQTNEVDVLAGAFMLLRKSVLDKIGLLDEAFFMYGEDIDLSYRVKQAGFKNYYFPEARIIHYKGESTKKSSVNYVFVFYNAMIIFAKKHFSQNNARIFSFLINIAIYLRASVAIANRFVKKMLVIFIDAGVLLVGLFAFKNYYEHNIRFAQVTGSYHPKLVWIAFCSYTFVWLVSTYFNGGYDKPIRLFKIVRGVLIGSGIILIAYSLLPETYRFSRALIIIGTVWALVALLALRVLFHLFKVRGYRLDANENKRIIIVGHINECERIHQLLSQTNIKTSFIGYVDPVDNVLNSKHRVGHLSQLSDIIYTYTIDEVIFSAKDIPAQQIIDQMLQIGAGNTDFKIAPPESISVIGSNSIDTSGDLYTIDVNSIIKPENKRIKRMFDVLLAFKLLTLFPINIFIIKKPIQLLRNIFNVLIGKRSWVGYPNNKSLPSIRAGILIPSEVLGKKLSKEIASRIDILYAKDYQLWNDVKIVWRGYRKLGN